VPSVRRNNCVCATLGTCYSVWMTVWYAEWSFTSPCIPDSCFSWWWAHSRTKHRENILRINCAPSWLYLQNICAVFIKVSGCRTKQCLIILIIFQHHRSVWVICYHLVIYFQEIHLSSNFYPYCNLSVGRIWSGYRLSALTLKGLWIPEHIWKVINFVWFLVVV